MYTCTSFSLDWLIAFLFFAVPYYSHYCIFFVVYIAFVVRVVGACTTHSVS